MTTMIRQTIQERMHTARNKETEKSRGNHGPSNNKFRKAQHDHDKKNSPDSVPKIISSHLAIVPPPPPPSDQSSTYPPSPHSPVRNRWGRNSGHDPDDAKVPPAFRAGRRGSRKSAPILPTRRPIDETQPEEEKYAPPHESELPRSSWPPVTTGEEDKVGARSKKEHPKSSLPDGDKVPVVRKASLRVRWGGDEIFFIEPRQQIICEDAYFMGDLLKDRFAAEKGGDGSFNSSMILGDRFESRRGDVRPPSCPARAQYSDMSNYADELDKLNWDEADPEQQQPVSDNKTQSSSRPFVWITTLDGDDDDGDEEKSSSTAGGLTWRVKRAWDDPALDELEAEHLVNGEEAGLMDMVKVLIGVGSKPSEEDAHYNPTLSLWNVKKFYDINGEIDSSEAEKAVDEYTMLSEIKVMSLESASADISAGNGNGSEAVTTQREEIGEAVKDKVMQIELTSSVHGSDAAKKNRKKTRARSMADLLSPPSMTTFINQE